MSSKDYWAKREEANRQANIKTDAEYAKEIQEIYKNMMDQVEKEINGFYTKYARDEGITMAEAKKRVSQLEIEKYERKAKRYVKNKDFSSKANEEMKLYNLTMKINRLELLKANIGLEMVASFDELDKFFDEKLTERTLEEFERQAGILGKTITNNAEMANSIVNASFKNATYSDRIWMYQGMMKAELDKLLQEGIIQGKHPNVLARHLTKLFGVSTKDAQRLMVTEMRRVQTGAQKASFEKNGFTEYTFIAEPTACPICAVLNGKHFKVSKMLPGENAPPMHPWCRCSTAAYMDGKEYEDWLDFLDKGGTTEEWEKLKVQLKMKSDLQYRTRYSKEERNIVRNDEEIIARKIEGSKNVFVAKDLELTKFEASNASKAVDEAYKLIYGNKIKHKPDIYILKSDSFAGKTTGVYRAGDNSLFLNEAIFKKETLNSFTDEYVSGGDTRSHIIHELVHVQQHEETVETFKREIRTGTDLKEYNSLMESLAKEKVDDLINTGYNYDVSRYAKESHDNKDYAEVMAELYTYLSLGGKKL